MVFGFLGLPSNHPPMMVANRNAGKLQTSGCLWRPDRCTDGIFRKGFLRRNMPIDGMMLNMRVSWG